MLDIRFDRPRRTVFFRATGTLDLEEVRGAFNEAKRVTDLFHDGEHMVLADMRGMSPMSPAVAEAFGEIIRYGRERRIACCIHLSDSSILRLQTMRLAREVNPQDSITTNVVSLDEAERVIEEKYRTLRVGK